MFDKLNMSKRIWIAYACGVAVAILLMVVTMLELAPDE